MIACVTCGKDTEAVDSIEILAANMYMLGFGCPFVCPDCNKFVFGPRAIRDIVFVWPIPFSEVYIEGGNIVRPAIANNPVDELYGRSDYGIVLSCGPGYYDNKRFNPTSNLQKGTRVLYDKFVPWYDYFKGYNGKPKFVVICGYKDIQGIV